jgi:O-antigen/teichoic acid export membrane protein
VAIPPQVAGLILAMTGHHSLSARAQIIGMVVNLGASIILAPLVGLTGVAFGTLIATVSVDVCYVMPTTFRFFTIPVGGYLRQVVLPTVVAGIFQGMVTYLLRQSVHPTSLWQIAVLALPGGFIFLLGFVAMLPSDERNILSQGVIRRFRRARMAPTLR